jgi:hypothetical protein
MGSIQELSRVNYASYDVRNISVLGAWTYGVSRDGFIITPTSIDIGDGSGNFKSGIRLWTLNPAEGESPLVGSYLLEDTGSFPFTYNPNAFLPYLYFNSIGLGNDGIEMITALDLSNHIQPVVATQWEVSPEMRNGVETTTAEDRFYLYNYSHAPTGNESDLYVFKVEEQALSLIAKLPEESWPVPAVYKEAGRRFGIDGIRALGDLLFIGYGMRDVEFPNVPLVAIEKSALGAQ